MTPAVGSARPPLAPLLVAAAVWPAAAPAPAAPQLVTGVVLEAGTERPLPHAPVLLFDSGTAAIDSAATDDAGRFRIRAPGPGTFLVHVARPGYLSYSTRIELTAGQPVDLRIEMPVVSESAARVMRDVIDREAAFQLPWEELCGEPVRPWDSGVLVGVSRRRSDLVPLPRAVVRLDPLGGDAAGAHADSTRSRSRVTTETGAFWFCNVPPGRARIVARADGFRADTTYADIRTGTISWYDALLRRGR